MKNETTIDKQEVAKFAQLASEWWNPEGALKTLHDINPTRIEFMRSYVDLKSLSVLDVGCGGGILSEGMARSGADVTAIDVEPDAIAAAGLHAAEEGMKVNYLCTPIESLATAPFDVITCMEMLEHVNDPTLVITHCARLLKPGGYLFLSTINRTLAAYAGAIIAAEYILQLLPRQTHDYEKFIKPSELAASVRAAGLDVAGIKGMSYNPLTRAVSLQDSVQINYLMACRKK